MAERWRVILEKLEADHKKRSEWEKEHPPITRISKQEADSQRKLTFIGSEAVTCDLPCHGNNIPGDYSHTHGWVNVFRRGIKVDGWEDPEQGASTYFGIKCGLNGRICVTTDETLRKAIEK